MQSFCLAHGYGPKCLNPLARAETAIQIAYAMTCLSLKGSHREFLENWQKKDKKEHSIQSRIDAERVNASNWRGMELVIYCPKAIPENRPLHSPKPIPPYHGKTVDVYDSPSKKAERELAEAFIAKRKQEGRKPIGKRSFLALLERRAGQ